MGERDGRRSVGRRRRYRDGMRRTGLGRAVRGFGLFFVVTVGASACSAAPTGRAAADDRSPSNPPLRRRSRGCSRRPASGRPAARPDARPSPANLAGASSLLGGAPLHRRCGSRQGRQGLLRDGARRRRRVRRSPTACGSAPFSDPAPVPGCSPVRRLRWCRAPRCRVCRLPGGEPRTATATRARRTRVDSRLAQLSTRPQSRWSKVARSPEPRLAGVHTRPGPARRTVPGFSIPPGPRRRIRSRR